MPFTLLRVFIFFAALSPIPALAQWSSYHFSGPLEMMHDLPVGETPGWSQDNWFNLEFGVANIWNTKASFTDTRNGNVYTYFADYEQEQAIAEIGHAFTDSLAFSAEVPYINHNGGFMDQFIDQYHQLIGSDRFERNTSPMYGNHFVVQTNGVNMLASEHAEGVGNIKLKLKYWLWHVRSPIPGVCDCGLAVSGQVKFPTQAADQGLSSGSNDYSELIHFGLPLGESSAFWATAALTQLGNDPVFAGWPVISTQQMYELSFQIGLNPHLGLLLQGRYESPFMDIHGLSFNYTTSDPQQQLEDRVSSGWNSLVYWRGSEDVGVRWHWGAGQEIGILFVEDWGIGGEDQTRDGFYINDAPDFQVLTQWHFVF